MMKVKTNEKYDEEKLHRVSSVCDTDMFLLDFVSDDVDEYLQNKPKKVRTNSL